MRLLVKEIVKYIKPTLLFLSKIPR